MKDKLKCFQSECGGICHVGDEIIHSSLIKGTTNGTDTLFRWGYCGNCGESGWFNGNTCHP